MDQFAMNAPSPQRVGVIVGARALRWQSALLAQIASLPTVAPVLIAAPMTTHGGWLWQLVGADAIRIDTGLQPVEFDASAVWDVLIDTTGTAPDSWAQHSRRGIWRLVDAAGQSLAQPFPGLASIVNKCAAEISLIEYRQCSHRRLRRANFGAAPAYQKQFGLQYTIAAQLVRQGLLDDLHQIDLSTPYRRSAPRRLSNLRTLGLLALGHARAAWQRLHRMLFTESWMIGRLAEPVENLLHAALPLKIQWLGQRESNRYLADPFCVPGAPDRFYCEVLDQRSDRGLIKQFTLNGNQLGAEAAVDFPVSGHLSYPYLFRENDQLYCVPEAGASRRCDLYVQDTNLGWRVLTTLLDGVAAADPTIFRWQERYWLAYTDADRSSFDNLCLAYADQLSGPWLPHANNPVKIDHRSARSAGTPFLHEGKLVRPAQDCSQTYGGAVALNQIEICTPTAYSEHVVRLLLPSASDLNPHGLHTIASCDGQVLVDGKRHVINPVVLMRKASRHLQRCIPFYFRSAK